MKIFSVLAVFGMTATPSAGLAAAARIKPLCPSTGRCRRMQFTRRVSQ